MANDNGELDKIISDGKTNPQIAMTVFAIEIRGLKDNMRDLKEILKDDGGRYATKDEVAFLRNILFSFVGLILTIFIVSVAKLVFKS